MVCISDLIKLIPLEQEGLKYDYLFSEILSRWIANRPYVGIVGQIFVHIDDKTRPHQDKIGRLASGRPGPQIYWIWKKS